MKWSNIENCFKQHNLKVIIKKPSIKGNKKIAYISNSLYYPIQIFKELTDKDWIIYEEQYESLMLYLNRYEYNSLIQKIEKIVNI